MAGLWPDVPGSTHVTWATKQFEDILYTLESVVLDAHERNMQAIEQYLETG